MRIYCPAFHTTSPHRPSFNTLNRKRMEVIQRCIRFHQLPQLLDLLHRLLRQRALAQPLNRLLQLRRPAGTNDNGIALLRIQRGMIHRPAVRQHHARLAGRLGNLLPLAQALNRAGLAVQLVVHVAAERGRVEAAGRLLGEQIVRVLGEEAAGERGVGVKGKPELAEDGEEVLLDGAGEGVVVALVDGGHDAALGLGVRVHLAHVGGQEVGEAEAGELTLAVQLLDGVDGLLDGGVVVGGVQVVDVDLVGLEQRERLGEAVGDGGAGECAAEEARRLGVDGEGLGRRDLAEALLAIDVDAGGVNVLDVVFVEDVYEGLEIFIREVADLVASKDVSWVGHVELNAVCRLWLWEVQVILGTGITGRGGSNT